MSSDVGAIVGPLVAGFLADRFSFTVAFAVGAAAWAGSVVLSARLRERSPKTTTHTPDGGQA
jgi:MFS family permease